jgi:hypothetical protein
LRRCEAAAAVKQRCAGESGAAARVRTVRRLGTAEGDGERRWRTARRRSSELGQGFGESGRGAGGG